MADSASDGGNLRRRVTTSANGGEHNLGADADDDQDSETASLVFNMENAASLAAYELAIRPGAFAGYLHKRAARCCKGLLDCFPIWNRRYFVLYGDYLYRYASNKSKKPKGVPLMLSATTVAVVDVVDKKNGFFLEIGDYRKEITVRCKTAAERQIWVQRLRDARMRIIREQKGHASVDKMTRAANRAGSKMYDDRVNMERKEVELQMKEMGSNLGVPTPLGR